MIVGQVVEHFHSFRDGLGNLKDIEVIAGAVDVQDDGDAHIFSLAGRLIMMRPRRVAGRLDIRRSGSHHACIGPENISPSARSLSGPPTWTERR